MSRQFEEAYFSEFHEEDYIDHYDDWLSLQDRLDKYDFEDPSDYAEESIIPGLYCKTLPGFSNYDIYANGTIISHVHKKPHKMHTWSNQYGHQSVELIDDDGVKHKLLVHRLVAMAFLKNKCDYPVVMHMDDNPRNNDIYNIKWGTQIDNVHDCINKGRNYTRKVYCYDTDTVYKSCDEAGKAIGADKSAITMCCRGQIKTVKGMIFCYLEDRKHISKKEMRLIKAESSNKLPVLAKNIHTGEQKIFDSRREASKYLGIPNCSISSCITGHLKQTHGWTFEPLTLEEYYG